MPAPGFAADVLGATPGLELLISLAHDLRSPLTSILFLAETLQRGHSGPVTETQYRQLGLIYGAALGLASTASDIIELARGGDQLVEKELVPFSVTGVLESVGDIVRPIVEEKKLGLVLVPPACDRRLGHPVALSRVLLNLTTNALKYTERGEVRLIAREVGATRIEFVVEDSGSGLDPETLAFLVSPRPGNGRKARLRTASGFGLLICRKLAHAMGSQLRVQSEPDRGTRISLTLELPPGDRAVVRRRPKRARRA